MLLKIAETVLPILQHTLPAQPLVPFKEQSANALAILKDDAATASAVFRAATLLVGRQLLTWEPESIWLELLDQGVDLSEVNRDKLMAVSTLIQIPSFYWEVNAFENTALAFNSINVLPESLQEASPAQLSWAVYEAELLMRAEGHDPEFDYEPARYAAVSMHRAGYIVAPELLVFAQQELDKLTRGQKDTAQDVIKRWDAMDKTKLDTEKFEESSVGVQLSLLAVSHLYVNERAERYASELKQLT